MPSLLPGMYHTLPHKSSAALWISPHTPDDYGEYAGHVNGSKIRNYNPMNRGKRTCEESTQTSSKNRSANGELATALQKRAHSLL
jgi:hypothetical protein